MSFSALHNTPVPRCVLPLWFKNETYICADRRFIEIDSAHCDIFDNIVDDEIVSYRTMGEQNVYNFCAQEWLKSVRCEDNPVIEKRRELRCLNIMFFGTTTESLFVFRGRVDV